MQRLERALVNSWAPSEWTAVPLLVAVSGGADSVALLTALTNVHRQQNGKGPLTVAHYNHGLRSEASDQDALFVQRLANKLGWPCVSTKGSGPPAADEASLRSLRYDFLASLAHQMGARFVVTGHTQEDNVETVLHHLFRGTGPAGLGGVPRTRDLAEDVLLIRPLLNVPKSNLREALTEIGQEWREDATNQESIWKRNWLRNQLLPQIETEYPGASDRIAALIDQQQTLLLGLEQRACQWTDAYVTAEQNAIIIQRPGDDDRFSNMHDHQAIRIHALRGLWDQQGWQRQAMARQHWERLSEVLGHQAAETFDLPGGVRASAHDGGPLELQRLKNPASPFRQE